MSKVIQGQSENENENQGRNRYKVQPVAVILCAVILVHVKDILGRYDHFHY